LVCAKPGASKDRSIAPAEQQIIQCFLEQDLYLLLDMETLLSSPFRLRNRPPGTSMTTIELPRVHLPSSRGLLGNADVIPQKLILDDGKLQIRLQAAH
jgi:hypothetical protein